MNQVLDLAVKYPTVKLSFDDGNKSDLTICVPALVERGLTAEFFLIAGRLGQPGSLDEDDIRVLVAAGMAIGSHGMLHRSWRTFTDDGLRDELDTARELLASATGKLIETAACPLGGYDRRVVRAVKMRGYSRLMTSDRAYPKANSWLQPRFSIKADDDNASIQAIIDSKPGWLGQTRNRSKIFLKTIR